MALVLKLKVGDAVMIGRERFHVSKIYDRTSFTFVNDDARSFRITENEAVEVMPDVFVSAGDLYESGIVRVVIDAPRDVLIVREKTRHDHEGVFRP